MDSSQEHFRGHKPELIPRRLIHTGLVHHPAVRDEAKRRNRVFELRLADQFTAFAGSMNFVWIHAAFLRAGCLSWNEAPGPR